STKNVLAFVHYAKEKSGIFNDKKRVNIFILKLRMSRISSAWPRCGLTVKDFGFLLRQSVSVDLKNLRSKEIVRLKWEHGKAGETLLSVAVYISSPECKAEFMFIGPAVILAYALKVDTTQYSARHWLRCEQAWYLVFPIALLGQCYSCKFEMERAVQLLYTASKGYKMECKHLQPALGTQKTIKIANTKSKKKGKKGYGRYEFLEGAALHRFKGSLHPPFFLFCLLLLSFYTWRFHHTFNKTTTKPSKCYSSSITFRIHPRSPPSSKRAVFEAK
ncbi:hypothetical protein C0J52_00650, partial [Blattella germanica]